MLYAFCRDICRGDYDLVMSSKTNRLSSYQVTFRLVDYFCNKTQTKLDFPFHHGQDCKLAAKAETDRRSKQNNAHTEDIEKLNQMRNNLPSYQTREMALIFLEIGKQQDKQDEKEMLRDIIKTNGFDESMFATAFVVKSDV